MQQVTVSELNIRNFEQSTANKNKNKNPSPGWLTRERAPGQ
jgi:hypothetical protein